MIIPRKNIKLVEEGTMDVPYPKPDNARELFEDVKPYFEGLTKEQVLIVALNHSKEILDIGTLSIGSWGQSLSAPREMVMRVLASNPGYVVFIHNHPTGSHTPSPQDIGLAIQTQDLLQNFDVELLDVMIISGDNKEFTSLRKCGLLSRKLEVAHAAIQKQLQQLLAETSQVFDPHRWVEAIAKER